MKESEINNNILLQIKNFLKKDYDTLIESLYGYGSRITYQRTDSDFDLAIITSTKVNWLTEYNISKKIVDFGIDEDIVFYIHFFSMEEFEHTYKNHPFIKNIKKEAIMI